MMCSMNCSNCKTQCPDSQIGPQYSSEEILTLFYGMTESMQKAVHDLMKVTQADGEEWRRSAHS